MQVKPGHLLSTVFFRLLCIQFIKCMPNYISTVKDWVEKICILYSGKSSVKAFCNPSEVLLVRNFAGLSNLLSTLLTLVNWNAFLFFIHLFSRDVDMIGSPVSTYV